MAVLHQGSQHQARCHLSKRLEPLFSGQDSNEMDYKQALRVSIRATLSGIPATMETFLM